MHNGGSLICQDSPQIKPELTVARHFSLIIHISSATIYKSKAVWEDMMRTVYTIRVVYMKNSVDHSILNKIYMKSIEIY